jgi:hypothetical protein
MEAMGNMLTNFAASALLLLAPQTPAVKTRYEYASDFVSFVGRDERGRVAFALDTNRGRDGETFQAEHFAVFYDEGRGWVELAGNGEFTNADRKLAEIANSKFYRYEGTPTTGLAIESAKNELRLAVEPLALHSRRERKGATFDTGSAAAKLEWKGRTLIGRAIYEGCTLPDRNLITDPDTDFFGDGWHGLYAVVDAGGDLRLHSADGDVAKLVLAHQGFLVLDGEARAAKKLAFEALDWEQGGGFFRWPTVWKASWKDHDANAELSLRLADRNVVATWVVGGFAVAIAKGELTLGETKHEVWGLAQIIR